MASDIVVACGGKKDLRFRQGVSLEEVLSRAEARFGAGFLTDPEGYEVHQAGAPLPPGLYEFWLETAGSSQPDPLYSGDKVGLDIKDIQELAAFARRQRDKAQTVRLSDLDREQWETIQRTAGLSFQPFDQKGTVAKGLLLKQASAFKWSKEAGPTQAKEYLSHIEKHLMYDRDEYQLFDARRFRSWLNVTGMVEQLGFRMAGTTDAALVLTQAVESGLPSTTSKWLWELKRQLKASSAVTGVAAAVTAEAAHLPDAPDQPKSSAVDASADAKELAQTAYAFQAMACLLLANIHAPNARPGITLTNLNDQNILYWLDGNTIMYYSAPDAATAWAMTNAFIQGEPSSGSEEGEHQFPAGLASVAKRQKLDLGKVAVGDATAGLSDLAAFLDHDEMKASQAASLLRELHGMPVFSGLARPLPDMMYA